MHKRLPQLGDWGSIEEVIRSSRDALGRVIERSQTAPFYFNRAAARFEDAPVITKNDLRAATPFGFLAVPKRQLATYHESSGSSGEPISSYFTESDWDDVACRFLRNAVSLYCDDSVLVKTPYSMVTTAHQTHRAARRAGALVVPADNRSTNMPYPKVIRLLRQIPVTVAWCLPTEALLWARTAELMGLSTKKDFPEFRAFMVAGETLSPAKKRRIEQLWGGIRVYEDYGSTETGSLGGECPHGKLHLWADRVFFEVMHEDGTLSTSGKGKLVVTPLYREAMPLIRYCLGDEVEVSHEECLCGWHLPQVRIAGRGQSEGKRIAPIEVEDTIYSAPLEFGVNFWRARQGTDGLDVEIECPANYAKDACHWIESQLHKRGALRPIVRRSKDEIVPRTRLLKTTEFQKPKFVFEADEDWATAVNY